MRKLLLGLFLLAVSLQSFAQYGAAGNPSIANSIPFQPLAQTSSLAATGTSATIALATVTGTPSSLQVQVYNSGTTLAFVTFCSSLICTATVGSSGESGSDYPVAPGAIVVITIPTATTNAAAVMASSTAQIYFTPGAGL